MNGFLTQAVVRQLKECGYNVDFRATVMESSNDNRPVLNLYQPGLYIYDLPEKLVHKLAKAHYTIPEERIETSRVGDRQFDTKTYIGVNINVCDVITDVVDGIEKPNTIYIDMTTDDRMRKLNVVAAMLFKYFNSHSTTIEFREGISKCNMC